MPSSSRRGTFPGRFRPHPARQVANFFIEAGIERGEPLTPLQVIKLVYFAHGWSLAHHDRPLVAETFKAWRLGPVIPDLYHALKHYEDQPVTEPVPLMRLAYHIRGNEFAVEDLRIEDFDEDDEWVLRGTYDSYSHIDGIDLAYATHGRDGAWRKARRRRGRTPPIRTDDIRREFCDWLG